MAAVVDGKLRVRGAWVLAGLAIFVAGCGKAPTATVAAAAPSSRPAEVPGAGVLTLATGDDMKAAAKFATDASMQKAVDAYLADPGRRWTLVAARPMGDYVLLWIAFPGVFDGGVDVIYSKKEQRVGWEFKGGERG